MILVTGGAGYIGSHTVRELRDRGMDCVVYDNLVTGHIEAVGDAPFVKGDIFDKELLLKTFAEYNVDSVVHFAAYSQVGESMAHPAKYYRNNVAGTLSLLDAMLEGGVKYLVFSSSAATYGESGEGLITEDSPQRPTSVYGQTKLMMEQFMAGFDRAYGMRYVALRYFNAAGAHKSGEIGEAHDPESHLIPVILQAALGVRENIGIYGDDYPTRDGTCIRDYIHITDLADAHIRALEYLKNGGKSTHYNLGNGNGFSVKEVIETARRVTGRAIPARVEGRRPGAPATIVASSEKIKRELALDPQSESLEEIVDSAWKWHSAHPHGYAK